MKNFKFNLNSISNIFKKNKIYKKTINFFENVKNILNIVHLKKKILQKYKEFYEEKFKISYLTFAFSLLFFLYLIYLSFPGILHSKKDQNYFTEILNEQYGLEFALTPELNYSILPKPHFQINDVVIFNKKNDFQKEIAQVKKLKIFLVQKNFFKKQKLEIKSVEFFDTNFFFDKSDTTFLKNFFIRGFNEKPLNIKRANLFYQELDKKTISFVNFKKVNMIYNNKTNQHNLTSEGNIFNLPFNLIWKQTNNKLENNMNLKFKKINLNILNSNKLINNEKQSKLQIISNRSRYIIDYILNNEIIEFNSENSFIGNDKITYTGKIFLDPFNFDINSTLSKIKFKNILSNNLFFKEILSEDFVLNENFNGSLKLDIKELDKNPLFKNIKINARFVGEVLDLSKTVLLNEKIANLILQKGSLYEEQNNLIFKGDLDFIINNPDKFYNKFVVPKKNRSNLKKINFEIMVNLTKSEFKILKIVNDNFKDKEFDQIDDLIYEFNSGALKISNWIEFKIFTNKIISSYSG
tara:strand:+ start:708 stop:2276 length:1569 start_codon:yes stop_codon:yes gene_type:complete